MRIRMLVTLMVVWMVSLPAGGQEIKLATIAPDGSNWMDQMRAAAGRIQERTDGQVRVRFYPGGVMGNASAVLRRMRLGQLHGGAFTLGDLASVSPAANLYSMPFVFRNREEVQAVRDEFDPLILDALEQGGMIVPAIGLGGFAYLFSSRELPAGADDIDSGLRVWVPPGDRLSRKTLELAGATPVPMPLADVYTSLQTGAVNTFASTPSATIILQWHTRARTMLEMPLLMTAGTVGIDKDTLERLAPEHRDILIDEFATVFGRIEQSNYEDNLEAREVLAEQGIEFIQPDSDAVAHWEGLARRTRREAMEAGNVELPYLDRLEERLGALRGEP